MRFDDLVVIAKVSHPIPFRTRPLNLSTPMVLCLKARESRQLPDLLTASLLLYVVFYPFVPDKGVSFYPPCKLIFFPVGKTVMRFHSCQRAYSKRMPFTAAVIFPCAGGYYCLSIKSSLNPLAILLPVSFSGLTLNTILRLQKSLS